VEFPNVAVLSYQGTVVHPDNNAGRAPSGGPEPRLLKGSMLAQTEISAWTIPSIFFWCGLGFVEANCWILVPLTQGGPMGGLGGEWRSRRVGFLQEH
jgi:hypothetical protein